MSHFNRRELVTATVGLGLAVTVLEASAAAPRGRAPASTAPGWGYGPFDSLRDYVAELDRRGLLLRIPRLDQDAFETTALMYRLIDRFGLYETPAFLIDEVKIDGRWVRGPVLVNQYGHYNAEAVVLGIEPVAGDGRATYRAAVARAKELLKDGRFPTAKCDVVSAADAPCKEVILTGDQIDLTKFAFIQSNPADAGRYINTGSVFTQDPQGGKNFGTYRCQLKGPRLIGVNPEPGQTGWRMLTKMRDRGDKVARVSIALGQDPITWLVSTSKIGMGYPDELELVGGLRGRPLAVVKSETNDILVPANAEMVIEGEIPLDQTGLPEGPFGEMRGYMGKRKEENFFMNVTRVTHRRDPWVVNQFTGVNRGMPSATQNMSATRMLQAKMPNITFSHTPSELPGYGFVSIRKTKAGEGLAAGELMARQPGITKVVIVVDDDIDVFDTLAVLHTVGARWQPKGANRVLTGLPPHQIDPSLGDPQRTSKFVLDATRSLPDEGGPEVWAEPNRAMLVAQAPEAFSLVDKNWKKLLGGWQSPLG